MNIYYRPLIDSWIQHIY